MNPSNMVPDSKLPQVYHEVYGEILSTSLSTATPQHLHRRPGSVDEKYLPIPSQGTASPIILATCSTLPHTPNTSHYRSISPSPQTYRHKPSVSLQGASYRVFPSPAKHTPSRLTQSKKTLLPLIAKFEVMDVSPSSSDVEKDKSIEGLKLRRTYRGVEAGLKEKATPAILNIKERTAGLKDRVLDLLEGSNSRNSRVTEEISEERRRHDNYESINIVSDDCRDSQRGLNNPDAPKTSGLSHSRQSGIPLAQENPGPSVSETHLRIGPLSSSLTKDSILRQRGVSKIRDKIWYFDGSPELYSQNTYFKDWKKRTNGFSEEASTEDLNKRLTLRRKVTKQLCNVTGREMSRPTLGQEFFPVREVERERVRKRVPRPGPVEPFHPTLINKLWNSQSVAKIPIRTTSEETKSKTDETQIIEKTARDNKVTVGEIRKKHKTALGHPLRQFLPPKTANTWEIRGAANLLDEKPMAVMIQSEENSRGQLKPREENLVRERIRQFSYAIAPTASASTLSEVIPRIITNDGKNPTAEPIRQFASGSGMSKNSASTDRQTAKIYTRRGTEPRESMNDTFGRGRIDTVRHRYAQRIAKYSTFGNVTAKELMSAEKEGPQLRKTAATQTLKTNVRANGVAAHENRNLTTPAVTKNNNLSTSSDKFARLEPRDEIEDAQLIEKPIQAKQSRFSTIKGKIKVFEDFSGRKLQRSSSCSTKESKVSVERDAARRYIVDLNLMTLENTSDFGAPLERIGRVVTRTSRGVKGDNFADQSDLKSKGGIRQWWNNGLEAMPSISKPASIKYRPETRVLLQKTRTREERAHKRAVGVSHEEESLNETQRIGRMTADAQKGDANTDGLNRNERKNQKFGSGLGDLQRTTDAVDGHALPTSSGLLKTELCFSSCLQSRNQSPVNESSMAVEYSCGNGTSSSTLKLVFEKRSATDVPGINCLGKRSDDVESDMKKDRKAHGRDRKLDPNINFHIVETVIAQCELTQPRPRRLLEIQRMVMLCRKFAKRDRSWSRELQGLCTVADVGFEAVEGNNETFGKRKRKERGSKNEPLGN